MRVPCWSGAVESARRDAASAADDLATLHETTGDHLAGIGPEHEAYLLCRGLVGELLG